MVRKHKDGVQPDVVSISKYVQDYYQEIILAFDIMHVNQIPFQITISRHIQSHTASVLPSMSGDIIVSVLQALYKFYQKRDFQLTEVLVDGQFAMYKHKLATMLVNLNCVSKDEHFPEVERLIVRPRKDVDVASIIHLSQSSPEDSQLAY